MTSLTQRYLVTPGFLRLALMGLGLVNILLAAFGSWYLGLPANAAEASPAWEAITKLITPVMAPLFVVVIFFDWIMSRVRAADATGEERDKFRAISRLEAIVMLVMLAYWVPFMMSLA